MDKGWGPPPNPSRLAHGQGLGAPQPFTTWGRLPQIELSITGPFGSDCTYPSANLKVLAWISAGSGLARCELCTGGLGVGMSLHYSALISARSVDHTPKP